MKKILKLILFILFIQFIVRFIIWEYDSDPDTAIKMIAIMLFIVLFIVFLKRISNLDHTYGYIDNKKITKDNTLIFRDIPFNGNVLYASALISMNNNIMSYNMVNVLGAIVLKWIRDNKVSYNKDTKIIDLNSNLVFDNYIENGLYNRLYVASKDGLLSAREMREWISKNRNRCIDLVRYINSNEIARLQKEGHIYNRKNRNECKRPVVMDDKIYEDTKKLYGLKMFLDNFSQMNTKEVIDVKIWDDYLMFAYLLGVADKVLNQFKKMYPNYIDKINFSNSFFEE